MCVCVRTEITNRDNSLGSHSRCERCRLRNSVFLYGRTSFKRLRDCEVALLGVSNAPKMTFSNSTVGPRTGPAPLVSRN